MGFNLAFKGLIFVLPRRYPCFGCEYGKHTAIWFRV